ncbi:MAG: hypothetical protein H8K09_13295 [Nitrospira sp.]|nr:hypothetical protein [Nitrospira sp.]
MLKELAEYLVQQSVPTTMQFDGLSYVNRTLSLMAPPLVPKLTVSTLTGLVDAVKEPLPLIANDAWVLWVESHKAVSVVSLRGDQYGRRACLVRAELPEGERPFRFDTFHDRESFVIGLQSRFVPSGPLTSVLEVASALTDAQVVTSEDDGISQSTTIKRGVASLKQPITVKGRVPLQPYRTFREIEQPTSEFIFRLQSKEGVPACALFEADGGKWQLDAMLTIKAWLEAKELGLRVVA